MLVRRLSHYLTTRSLTTRSLTTRLLTIRLLTIRFLTTLFLMGLGAACAAQDPVAVQAEVDQFFDRYIATYNRRFGKPEADTAFQKEIAEYLNAPLLQAPPNRPPRVTESAEVAGRNFAGFVSLLESKGVERLQWHEKQLWVLSPTQVLASNVGHGVNADGEIVYETVSIYLVYKIDERWKIISLSPYEIDHKITLQQQ